ncbi:hemerythrin [Clostridium saccharoperbutylacetonicum]|jgi:hemerythrin|uniref:Hemerythrin-like metal-binding protein n=1 Tax=Clostridium saccharoperbutylacetonicum N1-4(HMT) TaxID=931276 RepID=M1MPS6_9CLOT|nr:hemerythrin domain-containing protein [Clostridium saccharoperbutylacetonicum]AGF58208.1 hemerythrin-like metal-binding protein [Clostridium saccharoperbutylacetonicum N1-4(HMT)]NRT61018.1 hemerythrin [Clostridium saccharoperbutylacetonicum]NSB24333.1 hemerythrin [Clostridium saccharoperbutylacetonicum]NSB43709.1 hemerythrin [Clostridium saccharoperbutylacetonicum]
MKLIWEKSLEIGYPDIDNQHKELLERINYFFESVNSGATKEEVIRILDFLEKYTNDHCKLEEEIQRKYNYGKYNQQCIQHQVFRNHLQDIRYIYESYGVTGAVINYMQQKILDFWNYHIQKLDKDFGRFLKEKCKVTI